MFKLAAKWFLSVHAWVFSSLFNLSDLMFSVVGIRESVMILWWALSNNFIIICYCPQKYRKINITKSLCAKFGPYIYGNGTSRMEISWLGQILLVKDIAWIGISSTKQVSFVEQFCLYNPKPNLNIHDKNNMIFSKESEADVMKANWFDF